MAKRIVYHKKYKYTPTGRAYYAILVEKSHTTLFRKKVPVLRVVFYTYDEGREKFDQADIDAAQAEAHTRVHEDLAGQWAMQDGGKFFRFGSSPTQDAGLNAKWFARVWDEGQSAAGEPVLTLLMFCRVVGVPDYLMFVRDVPPPAQGEALGSEGLLEAFRQDIVENDLPGTVEGRGGHDRKIYTIKEWTQQ